jgi:hypothetical protein
MRNGQVHLVAVSRWKEQLVAVIMKMGGARHVSNDRDRHLLV